MAEKITLPPYDAVVKWKERKVIKWLKKVHLEDCVPAFENRHIVGQTLLELTEQKLFTFQDVKLKYRRQIAKCVNECKSQASNAKRMVGTIKPHSKETPSVVPSYGGYESEEDSSDEWDTDFDDDFEDELNKYSAPQSELNSNAMQQNCSVITESNDRVQPNPALLNRVIPKPPEESVIIASYNSNGLKSVPLRNNMSRPPVKRPPSQPPPPPLPPQLSSQEEPHEDYEIPINPIINQLPTVSRVVFTPPIVPLPTAALPQIEIHKMLTHCLPEEDPIETYEIIEPVEENYEMVDAPPFPPKSTEKPILPPRIPLSPTGSPPPPLPLKPRKLLENSLTQQKTESYRSLSRPKLPIKTEEEGYHETALSASVGAIGTTILQSLLGRRSSTPSSSPKLNCKRVGGSDSTVSYNVSIDSQSSRSSSPEKDGLIIVGSSSFISTTLSMELAKSTPPQLPPRTVLNTPEETAQNMATRPLPPVPTVMPECMLIKQQDIHLYPWFHEIERQEAEQEVKNLNQNGSFLVRTSKRAGKENPYTVTVLHEGRIFHLNIRRRPDDTFALGKEKKKEKTFPNVADLISHHQSEPILLTSRGESAGQTILHIFPVK